MNRAGARSSSHPQLRIIWAPNRIEYRVYNWKVARDGSGKVLKKQNWLIRDAFCAVLLSWAVYHYQQKLAVLLISICAIVLYVYTRITEVVFESVVAYPPHGIQLETHRGLPNTPLFVSRKFIPRVFLRDIIINEGLRRWNVRYYLALMTVFPSNTVELFVAYPSILPHFPVLSIVYRGVMEAIYPDFAFS